jgi:S-formylglutathione hydrolase FrmB
MAPQPPTHAQIRRRRRTAAAVTGVGIAAVGYFVLNATLFAPADTHGAKVAKTAIHSDAVPGQQKVDVVIPPGTGDDERRPLLVFLHGRNETVETYTEDEAFFKALARLGRRAPIVVFPEGSADSYWHDRADAAWGRFVLDSVIPLATRRFNADSARVAIGGISMGGFGAYDLALHNPGRFCAVGGHSPALWLEAGATAPGAFDDAEDFERNDVIATVRSDLGAFGTTPIWNDAGTEDPFRISDIALDEALEADDANLTARSWSGGHDRAYWDSHWNAYLGFYSSALARCNG